MSKLQEQVKFHVTEMFHMLEAQDGTLSWFTRFGDHWRELLKLYPDPRWISSLGAAPYCPWCSHNMKPTAAASTPASGVQQTPSPAPSESTKQTNPSPPPSGTVHYQVDLDRLREVLASELSYVMGTKFSELAEKMVLNWVKKGVITR